MAKEDDKVKGKEVQKSAGQMPAFMRGDAGRGTEGLTQKDIEMPRIKLLQGISPELEMYDGVRAGEFWHTIGEQSLGKSLEVIPVHISKRYVLWRPRWDGGGILARADDAVHWQPPKGEFTVNTDKAKKKQVKWVLKPTVQESGLAEWGTADPDDPGSTPAATEAFVIVVDLPEHPSLSPVALMLQRTALSQAKRFTGKLKISGAPIYGMRFDMESWLDNRAGQDFNNYRFTAKGFVEDEKQYERGKMMYENFAKTGVTVRDMEGAQDDEMPAGQRGGGEEVQGEKKF
jgi:hypothetical protein